MMMRVDMLLVAASVLLQGCAGSFDTLSFSSGRCDVPQWVANGLHGRGGPAMTQDAADQDARVNLVKQLDVQIIQEDSVIEGEDSGGHFWYRVQSDAVEKVNVRISGITIRNRHFDTSCERHFALAVLDRERSVNLVLADLAVASSHGELLRQRIHQHNIDGYVIGQLSDLYQLLQTQEQQHVLSRNLAIIDPEACRSSTLCSPQTKETLTTQSRIDDVLRSIQLQKIDGTEQTVLCGSGLENALIVRAITTTDGEEHLLPDVPIEFLFQEGSGLVDRLVRTDTKGLAIAAVHYVEPAQQIAEVVARIHWTKLPKDLPLTMHRRLEDLSAREATRFVIYPPGDAVSAGFDRLACRFASDVVHAPDTPLRVDDFFEKGTNAPTSLSGSLRSHMVTALLKTRAFRILDEGASAATTATIAVSGTFERDVHGDLWVRATMTDGAGHTVHAVAETQVSRTAFPSANLHGLRSSIVPDDTSNQHEVTMLGGDGAPMVLVPAGYFSMGTVLGERDERPTHQVYVDQYYMDQHEVTTSRYAEFVSATQQAIPDMWSTINFETDGEKPVVGVSWNDATAYCRWAKKRLPTEAEWEKAARGSDERMYPWGNETPDVARSNFNTRAAAQIYRDVLAPVSSHVAGKSPFGILNLSGNVWEWVADWYQEDYYARSPTLNPVGPITGEQKVLRGGSWADGPDFIRTTDRFKFGPSIRTDLIGFRCAMDTNDI